MLPRTVTLLTLGMVVAAHVVFGQNTDAYVDSAIEFCKTGNQLFESIELNFTKSRVRPPSEPNLIGPVIREITLKVQQIENRQRPFECLRGTLEGVTYDDLIQNDKYQGLVQECLDGKPFVQCDYDYPYRSIEGTCNNLQNPTWGAVLTCANRMLPAYYEGASGFRRSVNNKELPEPREISLKVMNHVTKLKFPSSTHLVFFGQFVAHDLSDVAFTFVNNRELDCCSKTDKDDLHPQCAPIKIRKNDPFYSKVGVTCINFVRSALCDTCDVGPRINVNGVTTFLDLSLVYGSTQKEAKNLRKFDGTGKLRFQKSAAGDLMPANEEMAAFRCGNAHPKPSILDAEKKCQEDDDCDSTEACDMTKTHCVDLCTEDSDLCGEGAKCVADQHLLQCFCPPGSTGDPYVACDKVLWDSEGEPAREPREEKATQEFCFKGGDRRTNMHTPLMSLHTVFLREHNRIAEALKDMNPHWKEERLYQEARKINIAQYQAIVYGEFLPTLFPQDFMCTYGLSVNRDPDRTPYDSTVDPTLSTEFVTAGYRLHSMVGALVGLVPFRYLYKNGSPVYCKGGMEYILASMGYDSLNEKYDRHLVNEVGRFLYRERPGHYGFDLSAVNIQRGRDHGLPPYVEMLRHFDGVDIQDFCDLEPYMEDENIHLLKEIYSDVRDVDMWVGMNFERPAEDMLVSPTASKVIAGTFRNLKFGDRFYFEHPGHFTDEQLQSLKQASLSKVYCDNTKLLILPKNAQEFPDLDNLPTPCHLLPDIDLQLWKEAAS